MRWPWKRPNTVSEDFTPPDHQAVLQDHQAVLQDYAQPTDAPWTPNSGPALTAPKVHTYADQMQTYVFQLREDLIRKLEEAGVEPDWDTLQIGADLGQSGDNFAIVASVQGRKK